MPFVTVDCPYCGESIDLMVDDSAGDQQYIEDCQVCCRPMTVAVRLDDAGEMEVEVRSENDA